MTGRKLYDKFCDVTADEFDVHRGGYRRAETPLASWPSLSTAERRRWSALARAITPKPRKVSA